MKLIVSPAAQQDLLDIGDYIAADNPARAVSFVDEIERRCQQITLSPRAAPIRKELPQGVRVVPYGNYVIFYLLLEEVVRIERVLHGARNISALLD